MPKYKPCKSSSQPNSKSHPYAWVDSCLYTSFGCSYVEMDLNCHLAKCSYVEATIAQEELLLDTKDTSFLGHSNFMLPKKIDNFADAQNLHHEWIYSSVLHDKWRYKSLLKLPSLSSQQNEATLKQITLKSTLCVMCDGYI